MDVKRFKLTSSDDSKNTSTLNNISKMDARDLISILVQEMRNIGENVTPLFKAAKRGNLRMSKRIVNKWILKYNSGGYTANIKGKKYGGRLLGFDQKQVVVGWVRARNREKKQVRFKNVQKFIQDAF